MHRLTRHGWVGLVAALALTGCASMRIDSYLERGADLRQYRTYAWAPTDSFATGDARLDNNRFFIERVQAAVERGLGPKGLERSDSGTPDLVVHYHARIDQRVDQNELDRQDDRCEGRDCRAFVYEAGTLVVDFVDARTSRLAWRGWAEGSLDGVIDDQDAMEAKIDDAVARILARFPR